MTANRTLPMLVLLAILPTAVAVAQIDSPGRAQQRMWRENQHLWQERQDRLNVPIEVRPWSWQPSPANGGPADNFILAAARRLDDAIDALKGAHYHQAKIFQFPPLGSDQFGPVSDLAHRELKPRPFATFETIGVPAYKEAIGCVLAQDTPALRRLEVRGTAAQWEHVEQWLERPAGDPTTAERLKARFARITEVVLALPAEPPTAEEFDRTLSVLRRMKRLTGLTLAVGRPEPRPADGEPWPPRLVWPAAADDLRGLAGLRSVTELNLTVDSLATVSFGFPAGLQRLTVLELDLSTDPLAHVRLPGRLRSLVVESDNPSTRDRFSALAADIPAAEKRMDAVPKEVGRMKQLVRSVGVWRKVMADGQPAAEMAVTPEKVYPLGKSLVPGYLIVSGEAQRPREPAGNFDLVVKVVKEEPYYADIAVQIGWQKTVEGVGVLRATVGPSVLTVRGEPFDPAKMAQVAKRVPVFTGSLIVAPDDGKFHKAACQGLEGEWRRVAETGPRTTELGVDDEPPAGDSVSRPHEPAWSNPFLTGIVGTAAFAVMAAVGVCGWWRMRKGRRARP